VSEQDRLSPELRAAEADIDAQYKTNAITRRRFCQAAWMFLASCEEQMVREVVNPRLSPAEWSVLSDNVVAHTKIPMRWILATCPSGGQIPTAFSDAGYDEGMALFTLGQQYSYFESAFTYASLGVLQLTLHDRVLVASDVFSTDTRFDAYDRLRSPRTALQEPTRVGALVEGLARTVRVRGEWFSCDLSPRMIEAALESLAGLIDSRFTLPSGWQFSSFTMGEFQRAARLLWTLAYLHFNARLIAANHGCVGLGYARALFTTTRRDLLDKLRLHAGLQTAGATAIVEALTFGGREQVNPDPALQPLIPLTAIHYGMSPNLVINSAPERNFSVLLNRIKGERGAYSRLSQDREALSRDHASATIERLGFRTWQGRVAVWAKDAEIDLVIISDVELCCVVLEMKAFVAPADAREVHERSKEIAHGIDQIRSRQVAARQNAQSLFDALKVDGRYRLVWAVASETSVGAPYVQAADVPVVQTRHLLEKLEQKRLLAPVCDWLERREFLPVENVHYSRVDFIASVGDWRLGWYGIRPLVDELA